MSSIKLHTVIAVLAVGYVLYEKGKLVTDTLTMSNEAINAALAAAFAVPVLAAILVFLIAGTRIQNFINEWQTRPAKPAGSKA